MAKVLRCSHLNRALYNKGDNDARKVLWFSI